MTRNLERYDRKTIRTRPAHRDFFGSVEVEGKAVGFVIRISRDTYTETLGRIIRTTLGDETDVKLIDDDRVFIWQFATALRAGDETWEAFRDRVLDRAAKLGLNLPEFGTWHPADEEIRDLLDRPGPRLDLDGPEFQWIDRQTNTKAVTGKPGSRPRPTADDATGFDTDEGEPQPFLIITENVWFDPDLSDGALRVFGVLRHFARSKDHCFPKLKTIGALINKSQSQVRERLRELERLGYIRTERCPPRANLYRLKQFAHMEKTTRRKSGG